VIVAACARVSKKTFYAHFPDKLACFLAAYEHGRTAMLDAVLTAGASAIADGDPPIAQLRRATAAYVEFLVVEQQFARTFFLEAPAAGPLALAEYQRCRQSFIDLLRSWHETARLHQPDWPEASELAYEAATAAANEIGFARVAADRAAELRGLVDALVEFQLDILRVPER
jgi:AcrR family transcriptional regulator